MLDRPQDWDGKPYHPISVDYKKRFGGKTVKIPVSIASTCPNRMGLKGMQTCIFCDEHGSFAYSESQGDSIANQIEAHQKKVAARFNAAQFLVYFQAYTTTFTAVQKLREAFDVSLTYPDIKGLVLGTRPDCLSSGLLKMWKEYSEKTYLSVEVGVQSFDDEQLRWMRRGHTREQAIKGIERIANEAGVETGLHLIFGWPTETEKQIIETAKLCNSLPIHNVKLHNLHVLTKTPLEELYRRGDFKPIELTEYADRVGLFLEYLDPKIAVHRLVALSSRWEELVAPAWVRNKMKSWQAVIDRLNERGTVQGKEFVADIIQLEQTQMPIHSGQSFLQI